MNSSLTIQNREIGDNCIPFVIAEIGINHEGSFDKAVTMIDDAHRAGCECVKFQCHIINDEMSKDAQAVIPGNSTDSIWDIMQRCSLTEEQERTLKEYVESNGMIYLSTPFSRAAANRLQSMNVKAYKIGSGECNNYPLVEHIARFGKPVILSTGMNDMNSIRNAVTILEKYKVPFALLHCTSIYPTPYDKIRLGALSELQLSFPGVPIGLSDHSKSNYPSLGAVALGACIIERHFTSSKEWPGPDIEISMNPDELKELIVGSEIIKESLSGRKEILKEEKVTIDFAYSSVVSIKKIRKGDVFDRGNIWVKRPGTGDFLAKEFSNLIGKVCKQNVSIDMQITREMVND